jgi:hypothetical protein
MSSFAGPPIQAVCGLAESSRGRYKCQFLMQAGIHALEQARAHDQIGAGGWDKQFGGEQGGRQGRRGCRVRRTNRGTWICRASAAASVAGAWWSRSSSQIARLAEIHSMQDADAAAR